MKSLTPTVKLLVLTGFILAFSSCSHYKWIHENEEEVCFILDCCPQDTTITNITIESDTTIEPVFTQIKDSSIFDFYLRCDSNNQVLMEKVERLSGQNDKMAYQLNQNVLQVEQIWKDSVESLQRKIQTTKMQRDTIILTDTKIKRVATREPYTPWYYWVLIGAIGLGAFLLGIKLR